MEEQMAPIAGAERIRAINDPDGMFKAFDSYPWSKDTTFMSGLYAILGDPNAENPRGTPSELALHARIFYYAQRIGVNIDFTKYKEWLAQHPDHTPPDVLPPEYKKTAPSADVPVWQASAPKADLYVEKKGGSQSGASSANGTADTGAGGQPAYPMGFAEMLDRIQKGLPVPGIKEIPDTVVRDPSIKPFGARTAPKKPWEKDTAGTEAANVSQTPADSAFPVLDDAPSN